MPAPALFETVYAVGSLVGYTLVTRLTAGANPVVCAVLGLAGGGVVAVAIGLGSGVGLGAAGLGLYG